MMNLFIQYFSNFQTWLSLVIPFVISIYCLKCSVNQKTHSLYYIAFLVSIPLTIFLSSWLIQGSEKHLSIGLNIYPIFIIVSIMIHILTGFRFSAYKAYAFTFINILIADVLCVFYPTLAKNINIFNFFYSSNFNYHNATYFLTEVYLSLQDRILSLGGAGLLDALFIYPLLAFGLFYILENNLEK